MASLTSATLDLPINQNLGFAYIVPYAWKAQFQMWYKWFVQLALRSGQFKTISATPVYEGQLIEENPLTWFVFDRKAKISDKVIGYASYFSLINGFEKTFYMTVEQITNHANTYSAQLKSKWTGLWKDKFDEMATKTVIKLLLSKRAPLSVEMQKAVIADQWVIEDENLDGVEYPDNDQTVIIGEEVKDIIGEMRGESRDTPIECPPTDTDSSEDVFPRTQPYINQTEKTLIPNSAYEWTTI
jgi:recombination protein RecT